MTGLEKIDMFLKAYPVFGEGFVQYEDEDGGFTYGTCVMNNGDIAVQSVPLKEGQFFDLHKHETKEWIIVYYGECIFYIDGKEIKAKAGDYLCVDAGVLHGIRAVTNMKVLAVTIPADGIFPKGV